MNNTFRLGSLSVGLPHPTRIVGVINVSPESFYRSSVAADRRHLIAQVKKMANDGADILDIGAMSTAPYLTTAISAREEARRLERAIRIARCETDLPISCDTSRSQPAEAALKSGATILNDVSGLSGDPHLAQIAKEFRGFILMASQNDYRPTRFPIDSLKGAFRTILQRAKTAKIPNSRIVLDPGIGFFRRTRWPWWRWDTDVLTHLSDLAALGFPLLVGVSRKSFIGRITGEKDPADRLPGSLAATAVAVLNGANLIRTHDVAETRQAVALIDALIVGRRRIRRRESS